MADQNRPVEYLDRLIDGLMNIAEKFADQKHWSAEDRVLLADVLHYQLHGAAGVLDVGRSCIRIADRIRCQQQLTEQDLNLLGELIFLAQRQAHKTHGRFKAEKAEIARWQKRGTPRGPDLDDLASLDALRLRDSLRDPDHHIMTRIDPEDFNEPAISRTRKGP